MKKNSDLVSIVVPVYNAASFLNDTIKTVQDQTYTNWELLFVDDGSKDDSVAIIKQHQKADARIKLLAMDKNSGAALARNKGTAAAAGAFLAFLDADDLWDKAKLQKQLAFMQKNDCAFSFTGYEFADETGKPNGKKVWIPQRLDYEEALGNTTIWTSTVMFNVSKIDRDLLMMPDIKSEDMATWWNVLKTGVTAFGLNEVLSFYRRSAGTLSSNKLEAIRRIWNLYRKHQKLSLLRSAKHFCFYAYRATIRRV